MGTEPGRLVPGIEATVEQAVTAEMTARTVGSGDVEVLATPMVVALVERAAVAALRGRLGDGETSVGVTVALDHVAPTPVGVEVRATATLEAVDRRRLEFRFEVSDPVGRVARGTHTRVVVDRAAFEASAATRGTSRG